MNELVERLTKGTHSVAAERAASADELRLQIEREFVLLKFLDTKGGTELGSQLDMQQTRLDDADFERGTGQVHLVGNLTLNYDKVQLVADIDIASLKGKGHLVLIEEESGSHARGDKTNDKTRTTGDARKNTNAKKKATGRKKATRKKASRKKKAGEKRTKKKE